MQVFDRGCLLYSQFPQRLELKKYLTGPLPHYRYKGWLGVLSAHTRDGRQKATPYEEERGALIPETVPVLDNSVESGSHAEYSARRVALSPPP